MIRVGLALCAALLMGPAARAAPPKPPAADVMATVLHLASLGDRSTGTPGSRAAADFIHERFSELGFEAVGRQRFGVPVVRHGGSQLLLEGGRVSAPLHPLRGNAITPQQIPPQGLEGPLVYVGSGELSRFDEKPIAGSILLMDLASGENWLQAAALGAQALIYIDRGSRTPRFFFEDKMELSPVQFPRFWMSLEQARKLFGYFENAPEGRVADQVTLFSALTWQEAEAENIYALVPGRNPARSSELIVVEAFYDNAAWVLGQAPGADEALSVAALLALAKALKENPPERSVLLVATAGHAQSLAGMREMVQAFRASSKDLRAREKELKAVIAEEKKTIGLLSRFTPAGPPPGASYADIQEAVLDRIKTEVDKTSRQLMQLRLEQPEQARETIQALAHQRLVLRRLSLRTSFTALTDEEQGLLGGLIFLAAKDHRAILLDVEEQEKRLRSALRFRNLVQEREVAAVVSLHLSSHGDGLGAFNNGWLYSLKPEISRTSIYSRLDEVLRSAAGEVERGSGLPSLFQDTLRPSRLRTWESYLPDRPALGGEVSALGGYLGVTLATVHDSRALWGTPHDRPERVLPGPAADQSALVTGLVRHLARATGLQVGDRLPRVGFSTVTGQAKFIRQGELFPDQPAPGTVLLAFQGPAQYHAVVDARGRFRLVGLADGTQVWDKVILEGYRFDEVTGEAIWAIDKPQTGRDAYRVKMSRRAMETSLIMFGCRQTTLFNLLEPRSFRPMTHIQLIDARREAPPMRYWYSRIDTRDSNIVSIFLEPGTRLKLTLSDTVLRKKLILTNAAGGQSQGIGYLVDEWPVIDRPEYRVARDMWTLLGPRIENLKSHGIHDQKLEALKKAGLDALGRASQTYEARHYDVYTEAAERSWALASRVYDQVEQTQRDVLFGVLFYIALFVPFAFCMERLLFSFTDIHKRIVAFLAILVLLIAVIYQVHPAFQLAYSPMVVILAFFIMGLSFIVTLIIFFRFEEEMELLQRRASQMTAPEISRWQAFTAAFLLGVSNLRRRRLRTLLTTLTLIILTFTVMSFTSVQTLRRLARVQFTSEASYRGFLLKNFNWQSLMPEAVMTLNNAFEGRGTVAPRVFLEDENRTRTTQILLAAGGKVFEAQGLVGLSAREGQVTGLDRILVGGRWFHEGEPQALLLPEKAALALGIDPAAPSGQVLLWGEPYEVVGVFSGRALQSHPDLDGEPLTPVVFPEEASQAMTEVETEAVESGEEAQAFQSRYAHVPADLTVIMPYQTLLAAGGQLKGAAVKPGPGQKARAMAEDLVDRFRLTIFLGESDGTFLYQASDTLSYSGVPNVIVPLLIAVFIVLNTMIGSVYERKREIAIYTSVGLAPSHVAFLFIAEAMAFAVLSVVLGYLLAQGAAAVFAGTSLWSGITVNYSSLAGVASMLLVFLVVLVSVLYPARVAAQIAIPDVNRSWKMPETTGNVLEVTLPFLMKYDEHRGVAGYLFSYLDGHRDVSHGLFSTSFTRFDFACPVDGPTACVDGKACCEHPCLRFHTDVWLAPFDFGIMQRVILEFCQDAEDPSYLVVRVQLVRQAGEAAAWRRMNKAFVNRLRKQLLIWRSLSASARDHFAREMDETLEWSGLWGGGQVKDE